MSFKSFKGSTKPKSLNYEETIQKILLCQLCNLSYLYTNEDELIKKINDLIEENKEIPLYKNLKFTDLKCWKKDQNFAFTVTLTLSPKYFFNSTEDLIEINLIVFRGTNSLGEVLQDITSFAPKSLKSANGKSIIGTVGMGFLDAYKNFLRINLFDYINACAANNRNLIITGHSLGGAIGNILALDIIMEKSLDNIKFALITFGSPRSIFKATARKFNKIVTEKGLYVKRFTNQGDLITKLPLRTIGYLHHIGETVFFQKNRFIWQVHGSSEYHNHHGKDYHPSNHSLCGIGGYHSHLLQHLKINLIEDDPEDPMYNPKMPESWTKFEHNDGHNLRELFESIEEKILLFESDLFFCCYKYCRRFMHHSGGKKIYPS